MKKITLRHTGDFDQSMELKLLKAIESLGFNCIGGGHNLKTGEGDMTFEKSVVDEKEILLGAISRGWCTKENETKEMDVVLAQAIAEKVQEAGFRL
jgi:hypothetical protein